jgi:hypothetical protein
MKVKSIFLVSFISLLFLGSCTDVLDKKDITAISEEEVWNNPLYATNYLNRLYFDNLPVWENLAHYSDESHGGENVLYGQLTNSSIDDLTGNSDLSKNDHPAYTRIRNINLFLSKIGSGSIDAETQSLLRGQALVLRAWRYFKMVRLYGGMPLILEPQDLTEDLYVTRAKTSECIAQIVKDLDDAIAVLPWSWTGTDLGRISKAAALALKGRVLLYYASPQFNRPGARDAQRWTTAYEVNKQAKEQLATNGYGLYESFSDLWFNEMNEEAVFVKRYQRPGVEHNWSSSNRPLEAAIDVTGANQPTWTMVQAFPMKDGVAIDESPDYDPVIYWKNRDPRFAATIAYNSCEWPLKDRASGTKQWTYRGYGQNIDTRTGYYNRKAVDVSQNADDALHSSTDWIEIRYAEVILNFAECAAETGHNDEAIAALKQIRARAGIEPGANGMYGLKTGLTGDALIAAVMKERQIELAFECKRYWDLRRRRMFETELNGTRRYGRFANLVEGLTPDEFAAIRNQITDWDAEYSTYFVDELELLDIQFEINYQSHYCFYGIPNNHLQANSKLQQTQGWPDNGSGLFDPYE